MFRIIANSTISFGLGYMFAIYGKPESPDWKNELKNSIDIALFAAKKDKQREQEEKNGKDKEKDKENALYYKYRVRYDEKGRAIYYGAP